MYRTKSLVVVIVMAVLLGPPIAGLAAEAGSGTANQATAADLIREAQRAVGQVVRAAQTDPNLKTDNADAKPFWQAMKYLNESLEKAETGLTIQDDTFFSNLATAVAAVQQAEIALTMNASSNAAVTSGMGTLAGIVRALDDNYSKEAARVDQGDKLTAAEKKQLKDLKAKAGELEKKLGEVEKKAAKNDKNMQEGIEKIRQEAKKIRKASRTANGLAAAMVASRFMSGMVWGWHWWWGPWGYWGPGWIDINIIIWDDWIDVCPYDWDLADSYIDTSDLGLDTIDFEAEELADTGDWLDEGDFSLSDADMVDLTDNLDVGWDEVDTDAGAAVMQGMESNFDAMPYEPEPMMPMDTFDDFGGYDDFGGDFGDW